MKTKTEELLSTKKSRIIVDAKIQNREDKKKDELLKTREMRNYSATTVATFYFFNFFFYEWCDVCILAIM